MTSFFHLSHCLKKHPSVCAALQPRKALTLNQFLCTGLPDLLFSSVSTEVANPEECAQLLRHAASTASLSPQYWLTLHCLLRHFARVCQNCSKNLLSARALGEIFSPVFFRQQVTRWVSEQPARASAAAFSVKDRHSGNRQTDKRAGSVMQGGGTQTLKHAHLQTHFRKAPTLSAVCQALVAFSCTCI